MKRHTCVICGCKRYEHSMDKVLIRSWACNYLCSTHFEIKQAENVLKILKSFKILKLQHLS